MKKLTAVLLALVLALSLAACSSTATAESEAETGGETAETVTIKVGASPSPHAEILEQVVDVLAAEGVVLEIVEYTDYVQPNLAVESGDLDANYFQHQPYLDDFNAENGTSIVTVAAIHYEPLGI
ncbi:MAG: MetQ/NlpA family ABC transporter substrate-binding protein, partial [Oscillospiraceae bacterium]|nr:MetQ/NlpA family ABC transporter substrate-binding protein [Oscillospiraceae bacterium]